MGASSPALEPQWELANGYGTWGNGSFTLSLRGPEQRTFCWNMVNHYWAFAIGCSPAGRQAWLPVVSIMGSAEGGGRVPHPREQALL